MPPGPGGLIDGWLVRETLHDGLPGLEGMDYAPLRELAGAGMPPTVVFHGRLLDGRLEDLRAKRDFPSIARLLRRRDLERIAALDGVTWVGAEEFVRALRAHEAIEPAEDGPRVPGGHDARLLQPR
jgi:hypothetical protein